MKWNSFTFPFAFCASVSFRFNHGAINCAISPVSAINHVSRDAAYIVSVVAFPIATRFLASREKERDPDFFYEDKEGSLPGGSYDKG